MSRCYGCMKYGVIYVAFIFMAVGIALTSFSIYLLARQDNYLGLAKDNEFLRYVTYSLLAGSLLLLGGILGCCGGLKQSSLLLGLFFVIALLISLAELAAGVYVYIHNDEFADYFRSLMTNSLQNFYQKDPDITAGWDLMQKEIQCCGATSYKDYMANGKQGTDRIVDMTLSSQPIPRSFLVPASCCKDVSLQECEKSRTITTDTEIIPFGGSGTHSAIFKEGCAEKLIGSMMENMPFIIGVLIGIGSLQILCLLFTCVLVCAFRSRNKRSYKN